MRGEPAPEFPAITDDDIEQAAAVLGLPRLAFHGTDRADPRQLVIKCTHSIDVAACPGSGKTTALVAKLAILASKWTWRTRGMCVLSHTNAARSEIEQRLGCVPIGQQLLSYPHFVGTIHGFLNEYLALPWLRSQGYPVRVIDNSICQRRVWKNVDPRWRSALEKKHVSETDIVIRDARFTPGMHGRKFPYVETTRTYQAVKDALERTSREGYFRHDDSLVWANDLIDRHGDVVRTLRDRFPLVFVDEAQDNSEVQSAVLHRIFGDGVVQQRFGDSNQAVFNSFSGDDATTDAFPIPVRRYELPNSLRFGQCIAALANPLGVQQYDSGFSGHGPCRFQEHIAEECKHTVFLFRQGQTTAVLDAYGQLLIDTFPDAVLRAGRFTAVSQVHNRPHAEREDKKPYSVADYWPQYDPTLPHISATPRTLAQCIVCGVSAADATGCAAPAVERIAEGILHLARMLVRDTSATSVKVVYRLASLRGHKHCHRYICSCLASSGGTLRKYQDMVHALVVQRVSIDKASWDSRWRKLAAAVAEELAGEPALGEEAERYLSFDTPFLGASDAVPRQKRANVYRFPQENPRVEIEIGSIHSVKGQTHTATLLMESFWHDHNLESLKEWILDPSRRWKDRDGVQKKIRLRLHYVAMTRPTHLLCLAMRRSTFEDAEAKLDLEHVRALEERGWRIREV